MFQLKRACGQSPAFAHCVQVSGMAYPSSRTNFWVGVLSVARPRRYNPLEQQARVANLEM